MNVAMKKPTWKNTLYSGHAMHSLNEFASTTRALGYTYIESITTSTRPVACNLGFSGRLARASSAD